AVVSWSQYHSIHIAGLLLKRRCPDLPWVVHMSDPWVDNPFVSYGALGRAINGCMERNVLALADRIIFTTEETADLIMEKYPARLRDKVKIIPHSFDPALYPDASAERGGNRRLVARYIGNFY